MKPGARALIALSQDCRFFLPQAPPPPAQTAPAHSAPPPHANTGSQVKALGGRSVAAEQSGGHRERFVSSLDLTVVARMRRLFARVRVRPRPPPHATLSLSLLPGLPCAIGRLLGRGGWKNRRGPAWQSRTGQRAGCQSQTSPFYCELEVTRAWKERRCSGVRGGRRSWLCTHRAKRLRRRWVARSVWSWGPGTDDVVPQKKSALLFLEE